MARLNALKVHQSWEDMFSAALAILLLISPIMVSGQLPPPVMASVLVAGIVVLAVSLFEIMMSGRWEEIIQFVAGVWVAVSVFILDYGAATQLRIVHFVLGALVAVMAAWEFWQDTVKKAA
jgi:hypothetical protein